MPESFKVLMKEMQALCLDIELIEEARGPTALSSATSTNLPTTPPSTNN